MKSSTYDFSLSSIFIKSNQSCRRLNSWTKGFGIMHSLSGSVTQISRFHRRVSPTLGHGHTKYYTDSSESANEKRGRENIEEEWFMACQGRAEVCRKYCFFSQLSHPEHVLGYCAFRCPLSAFMGSTPCLSNRPFCWPYMAYFQEDF